MKKLIMTIAIVYAVVSVQAASVSWGGAAAQPGDSMGVLSEGSKAALLWSEVAFSGAATTLDNFAVGGVADNGGKVVSVGDITPGMASDGSISFTYDNVGKDVNGYYAILVADGSDLTKASYMDMGQISGTTPTSAATSLKLNPNWDTDEFLNSNGYNTAVGVPEPTSGILLVLGIAGMALRRRRV